MPSEYEFDSNYLSYLFSNKIKSENSDVNFFLIPDHKDLHIMESHKPLHWSSFPPLQFKLADKLQPPKRQKLYFYFKQIFDLFFQKKRKEKRS